MKNIYLFVLVRRMFLSQLNSSLAVTILAFIGLNIVCLWEPWVSGSPFRKMGDEVHLLRHHLWGGHQLCLLPVMACCSCHNWDEFWSKMSDILRQFCFILRIWILLRKIDEVTMCESEQRLLKGDIIWDRKIGAFPQSTALLQWQVP